jgi:hypothetical protein
VLSVKHYVQANDLAGLSFWVSDMIPMHGNEPLIFLVLTYMSIRVEMKRRIFGLVRTRDLIRLPRLYVGDNRKRTVLVTREIAQDIVGPDGGFPEDDRLAQLRGDLDAFAVGEAITIARDPHEKPSDADLAPLDPVSSHVWDFRVREPPEGIRCVGFFVAKDFFVALAWHYREDVKPGEFGDLVDEAKAIWDSLFAPLIPHYGEFPHAYISKPFRAV